MAKDVIKEPFCALNADDFYGKEAYRVMAEFLTSSQKNAEFSMVGYQLKNTLSDFGSVSRGICDVNNSGELKKIVETTKIYKKGEQILAQNDDESTTVLTGKEVVSMNIWGFHPSVFTTLENKFIQFLKTEIDKPKSEMYIPTVVFEMIEEKTASVKVLEADSPWFGVTYKEDKPFVVEKINRLIAKGEYPKQLYS